MMKCEAKEIVLSMSSMLASFMYLQS